MISNQELTALEKRVYVSQFQDGLIDIFAGLGVLLIGMAWMSDYSWAGALVPAVLFPFWPVARKQLIEPRAGSVQLGAERQAREGRTLTGLALFGLVILVLGLVMYFLVRGSGGPNDIASVLVPGLPNFLLAIAAVLVALSFGLPRFLLHAGLLLGGSVIVIASGGKPGVGMAASGAAVLGIGVVLLVQFMQKHPIPEQEIGS